MVTLTIKNIPPEIYARLKTQAENNHRSINREVISVLEKTLFTPPLDVETTLERTRKLRDLTAHYVISAEEIEKMINEGRG